MVRSPAEPMRLPEIGLLLQPEDTCIRQRPTGQRRLAMVSGGMACTLRQFLKLTPKDVIELQLLCYFPRNIEVVRAPGILVRLLQQQNVRLAPAQKIDDPRQLQSAINVPAHNLDRTRRAKDCQSHARRQSASGDHRLLSTCQLEAGRSAGRGSETRPKANHSLPQDAQTGY